MRRRRRRKKFRRGFRREPRLGTTPPEDFRDYQMENRLAPVEAGIGFLSLPFVLLFAVLESVWRRIRPRDVREGSVEAAPSITITSQNPRQSPRTASSWTTRLKALRRQYAKAYDPWSDGDDLRLIKRFEAHVPIRVLAMEFQRKPGAIRSRLKKLGLIH
jgi:hypothetical protein